MLYMLKVERSFFNYGMEVKPLFQIGLVASLLLLQLLIKSVRDQWRENQKLWLKKWMPKILRMLKLSISRLLKERRELDLMEFRCTVDMDISLIPSLEMESIRDRINMEDQLRIELDSLLKCSTLCCKFGEVKE